MNCIGYKDREIYYNLFRYVRILHNVVFLKIEIIGCKHKVTYMLV